MKTLFQKQGAAIIMCALMISPAFGMDILSRKAWGAKPAIEVRDPPIEIVTTGKKRTRAENKMPASEPTVYLTVHHNQEPVRTMPLAEQLRAHQALMFHYTIENKEKGFITHIYLGDTPYHFFIDSTGEVAEGRELRFAAYSNTVYKTPIAQHITIVLEGDFGTIQPTANQITSLVNLLERLAKEHKVRLENIGYHKIVAVAEATDCPGKNLIDKFGDVKAELAKRGIK